MLGVPLHRINLLCLCRLAAFDQSQLRSKKNTRAVTLRRVTVSGAEQWLRGRREAIALWTCLCEMSSRRGAGRRFPQHVQAFKRGSSAVSSCSVFRQSKCSGIFKPPASLFLAQIISKLPVTVFLCSPTSVPHHAATVSSQVPV